MKKFDVFISYSSVDREKLVPVVDYLHSLGLSVWWDQQLLPGAGFEEQLIACINAAKCVLVCWSKSASESSWVATEYRVATGKRIFLRMDDTPLSSEVSQENVVKLGDIFEPSGQRAEALRIRLFQMTGRTNESAESATKARYTHRMLFGQRVSQDIANAILKAEHGDRGSALFNLAMQYQMGETGVRPDEHLAILLYSEAASFGHIEAMWRASKLHLKNKSFEDAIILLEHAAKAECVEAQFTYAIALHEIKRIDAALYWAEAAANHGSSKAAALAGIIILESDKAGSLRQKGVRYLQTAVASGDPVAAMRLFDWISDRGRPDEALIVLKQTICTIARDNSLIESSSQSLRARAESALRALEF